MDRISDSGSDDRRSIRLGGTKVEFPAVCGDSTFAFPRICLVYYWWHCIPFGGAHKSGKVRRVGVSNHNIKEIRRANEILGAAGFRVSAVQNHFSLLYRSSERGGVLDYCKQNGIWFWASLPP